MFINDFTGDSGYPLEPRLMTPYTNPSNQMEIKYNVIHSKTRNVIERCFGVLKSRFRCLDKSGGTLLYSAEKTCQIIVAVVVLHNMCIERNVQINVDPDVQARDATIQPATTNDNQTVQHSAVDLRRQITQQF